MKLALFAFEPFGEWEGNSTREVTAEVASRLRSEGQEVVREVLPVVLRTAPGLVASTLERERLEE